MQDSWKSREAYTPGLASVLSFFNGLSFPYVCSELGSSGLGVDTEDVVHYQASA